MARRSSRLPPITGGALGPAAWPWQDAKGRRYVPRPEPVQGPPSPPRCHICKRLLDMPDDPYSRDCGGDCLMCMADAGDPDCEEAVAELAAKGIGDPRSGYGF